MKWKKILVVYYSRSGKTKKVAEEIARKLHADIEEIKTAEKYSGFLGYQRALFQAIFDRVPKIERVKKNLADYDLIVIGGPLWGGSMSAPIRSFITKYADKFSNLAFFSSQGGKYGKENLFEQMKFVTGCSPWATLAVSNREMENGNFKKSTSAFVNKLQHGNLKPEKNHSKNHIRKKTYAPVHAQH